MNTVFALVPLDVQSTWGAFVDRLFSDPARFGLLLAGVLGIGGLVGKTVTARTGILAGLGAGWFLWQGYNFIFKKKTHLFLDEPRPSQLWDFMFGQPAQVVVAIASAGWIVLSLWSSTRKTNGDKNGKGGNEDVALWQRIIGLVALWLGIMLAFGALLQVYYNYFG